jgi:hypothetical protein
MDTLSLVSSGLNAQFAHLLRSLQVSHTSPGVIWAILQPVSSMSVSSVEVMGFPKNHANLRKLQLPRYDSSGVYAMVFTSFLWFVFI